MNIILGTLGSNKRTFAYSNFDKDDIIDIVRPYEISLKESEIEEIREGWNEQSYLITDGVVLFRPEFINSEINTLYVDHDFYKFCFSRKGRLRFRLKNFENKDEFFESSDFYNVWLLCTKYKGICNKAFEKISLSFLDTAFEYFDEKYRQVTKTSIKISDLGYINENIAEIVEFEIKFQLCLILWASTNGIKIKYY